MISNLGLFPRTQLTQQRKKKMKKLMFVKIRGMGCKEDNSRLEFSIVRTGEEDEGGRRRRRKKASESNFNRRNHNHHSGNNNNKGKKKNNNNVVVDVPDVCCTPPGIGIASDFAPRTSRNATVPAAAARLDHRKHPREGRRNGDDPTVSRTNHRSAEEIIQMLMAQQTLLYHRIIDGHDRHHNWRLNTDNMSYEELLDLSNKIGYVGTGLQEKDISIGLRRFKSVTSDCHKDWKCSICQDKCRTDDEIRRLKCGHYHHVQCIKQWLLQKNQCPVCKSVAISK